MVKLFLNMILSLFHVITFDYFKDDNIVIELGGGEKIIISYKIIWLPDHLVFYLSSSFKLVLDHVQNYKRMIK